MRDFLVWALFFGSSIFGHVALKRGTGSSASFDPKAASLVFVSPWGIAAMLSWALSCWLWALLLTRHSLFTANSVSTIRYIGICLFSILFLKEVVGMREILGMLLITGGIFLISR